MERGQSSRPACWSITARFRQVADRGGSTNRVNGAEDISNVSKEHFNETKAIPMTDSRNALNYNGAAFHAGKLESYFETRGGRRMMTYQSSVTAILDVFGSYKLGRIKVGFGCCR